MAGPSGDVAVSEVTWVTTDPDGNVECGVASDPAKAPTSGTAADVIGASKGWTMSDAAHDAAGLPATLPATGGEPVTDAGGNAVTPSQGVADAAGAAGESGSQAGTATSAEQQHQAAASQGGSQASGGKGQSSGGSTSGGTSGSGSQAAQPAHQHTWVNVTREEPVYEQRWVSNYVDVYKGRQEKYVCNGCGFTTSSLSAMGDHFDEAAQAGRYSCGSYVDDSYDIWEKEDQGSYKQVQVGTKTVVTGQRCTGCGGTR